MSDNASFKTRSDVVVRQIELADLDKAQAYAARAYRPDYAMFQPDFFDWQFRKTAGRDQISSHRAFGAFVDGEMIGASLVALYPMVVHAQKMTGGWIHFWFSDPAVPALGMTLLKRSLQNLPFLGGAAIEVGAVGLFQRLYRPMSWFELKRLFAPLSPRQVAQLIPNASGDVVSLLGALSPIGKGSDVSLRAIERFDDRYDLIWRPASADFALATDRDHVFMNWRYVDHPKFQYQRLMSSSPVGEAAFVWREESVLLPSGDRIVVARMCEAIGAPAALAAAIPAVLNDLKGREIAFVDFFCSNTSVLAALRAGGMRDVVTRPGFELPHRLQPPSSYVSKSIDFYYFAPDRNGEISGADPADTYITRGDSNQDAPIVIV